MILLIIDPKLNIEKENIGLIISSSPISQSFKENNAEIIQFTTTQFDSNGVLKTPMNFKINFF